MSSPSSKIQPPPQTQAATGKYTRVAQTPAKTIQGPNRARSAIDPEIRATVMMAKVAPKAAPNRSSLPSPSRLNEANGLPANCSGPSTADMLYP